MVTRTMEAAQVDVQADEYGKGARRVKVGDRVKSLVTEMDVVAGKEYVVSGACGNCVIITDDAGEAYPLDTGEWAVSDEPRFKVGDRVRLVKDGKSTIGAVGKLATIESWDGKLMNNGEYLLNIDPPYNYQTLSVEPQYTRAKPDCIEPVLSIQSGKYYRTRDGRKVGPMRTTADRATHNGADWWPNGRANSTMETSADLIAEWADEPQGTPQEAASNDNAAITLALTINCDIGDTLEKLDAIISRLRQIDDMASELGISLTVSAA